MGAVDPSYPLLPVVYFLSSLMTIVVLVTGVVRQSWNLGVTFLCFWLSVEGLVDEANFIIWSSGSEVKHHVYCDIGSCNLPKQMMIH